MWREAVLPARQGRAPLHSVVDGVCRTNHFFHSDLLCRAKHSRFCRAGGKHPRAERELSTQFAESRSRGGQQSRRERSADGLEASRDKSHEILELSVVAVL